MQETRRLGLYLAVVASLLGAGLFPWLTYRLARVVCQWPSREEGKTRVVWVSREEGKTGAVWLSREKGEPRPCLLPVPYRLKCLTSYPQLHFERKTDCQKGKG